VCTAAAVDLERNTHPEAHSEALSLAERKSRLSIGKLAACAARQPSELLTSRLTVNESTTSELLTSRLLLVEAQQDLTQVDILLNAHTQLPALHHSLAVSLLLTIYSAFLAFAAQRRARAE
jgi:hypothetical protein